MADEAAEPRFTSYDLKVALVGENGSGKTTLAKLPRRALRSKRGGAEAARRTGAHDDIERLARGYDTMLGPAFEGGTDLSLGQWQRLALARVFFRDAPFVILDELTAALDACAETQLFDAIRTLLGGRSVLLISHRFSSVRTADRIYVLHDRRIAEPGPTTTLWRPVGATPSCSPCRPPPTADVRAAAPSARAGPATAAAGSSGI